MHQQFSWNTLFRVRDFGLGLSEFQRHTISSKQTTTNCSTQRFTSSPTKVVGMFGPRLAIQKRFRLGTKVCWTALTTRIQSQTHSQVIQQIVQPNNHELFFFL